MYTTFITFNYHLLHALLTVHKSTLLSPALPATEDYYYYYYKIAKIIDSLFHRIASYSLHCLCSPALPFLPLLFPFESGAIA